MTKPVLILDQHFRTVHELFDDETLANLKAVCDVEGGLDAPMQPNIRQQLMKKATFYVAARPEVSVETLDDAPNLRAVIEVSGAFHGEIDYAACVARGVEVLSCAPGFRDAVAEMGLAMLLAAARGLVAEHEAFRVGREAWLDDRNDTDFSIFNQRIGFVGYGNIAAALHDLLKPFDPQVAAFDPWRSDFPGDVTSVGLDELCQSCRAVFVTAVPTKENSGLIGAELIGSMMPGAALILLSRAHVIDMPAAIDAANSGHITFATDVFPSEPEPEDSPLRHARNVILSPHRAAAVPGGRQAIGRLILHDVEAILAGKPVRQLLPAHPDRVSDLVAAQMAIERAGKLANT